MICICGHSEDYHQCDDRDCTWEDCACKLFRERQLVTLGFGDVRALRAGYTIETPYGPLRISEEVLKWIPKDMDKMLQEGQKSQ